MSEKENHTNQGNHGKQTLWQIYFPFLLALTVIGWAAYKLFQGTHSGITEMRIWADISTILIILPWFLIILLLFLIVILFSVLFGKSSCSLRKGFSKLNQITKRLEKVSRSICKAIEKFFIDAETYTSIINRK